MKPSCCALVEINVSCFQPSVHDLPESKIFILVCALLRSSCHVWTFRWTACISGFLKTLVVFFWQNAKISWNKSSLLETRLPLVQVSDYIETCLAFFFWNPLFRNSDSGCPIWHCKGGRLHGRLHVFVVWELLQQSITLHFIWFSM